MVTSNFLICRGFNPPHLWISLLPCVFQTQQEGFKNLELVWREFMCGYGHHGKPKTPLIAWDMVSSPKLSGRLGVPKFSAQAGVLKIPS